jgi:tripartite-type tricarboxylate transporter receptor subunit TctC
MLPHLKRSFQFNAADDFTNIAPFASFSTILALNKSVPANTPQELISYAKANPGKIRYGSGGVGSALHLVVELLSKTSGVDLVHVPYKSGSGALTDALAGHIEMASLGLPNALSAKEAGLRVIAQTGLTRNPLIPEVPTTIDAGFPEVQMIMWFSLMAPRNTPTPIVDKLSNSVREVTESPEFRQQLEKIGTDVLWLSPSDLKARMDEDNTKWKRVISEAGLEKID